MGTSAPTAPTDQQDQRPPWVCRFCHRQLGIVEDGALRVLPSASLHYPDRIEVRCPGCRRAHTFPIADLPAPAP